MSRQLAIQVVMAKVVMEKDRVYINEGAQSGFVLSQAPSQAVVAGFGSGKTYSGWLKVFNWLQMYPGVPMGYFAPTVSLIRDIFIPEAEEFCSDRRLRTHYDKQEGKFYIQGFAPIFCRSMHLPENIVGFQIGHAMVDEIDILPHDKAWQAWRKIKARCRKKMYKPGKKHKRKNEVVNQMALATTPEGFKFAYQAFKQDPLPDSELYQMSTYDNAHNLPATYIDELRANYPAQLIDAYINGIFTNLTQGRVWIAYDRNENRSTEHWDGKEALLVGMDFNVERGCAVVYVRRNDGLHAVDEVVNTYDTPATIRVLKERYGEKTPVQVIPDATGRNRKSVNATISDITLLKEAGYRVVKNEINPNIKDRIMATNAMFCNSLGERRMFINDRECPHYAEALETQAYDDNGLPEKGEGKMDDITDAGSYPIAKLFPIKRRSTQLKRYAGI